MASNLEVQYYLELQGRISDIFHYVSCHESNFETFSTKIESVLVDNCSFFDSLCQHFIRQLAAGSHSFKKPLEEKFFLSKVQGKKDFNISDYQQLLDEDFSLSEKTVLVKAYQDDLFQNGASDGYLLSPFEDWKRGSQLSWWKAFTNLKHDRLSSIKDANLRNAVFSLGGVFVVLSQKHEQAFKEGNVDREVYNLFEPKYWQWSGSKLNVITPMWKE